jgi:hypothetical protein
MSRVSRPLKRYRVKHWPTIGAVIQVMPWTVIRRLPPFGLTIEARCYTRAAALRICAALNAQKGSK